MSGTNRMIISAKTMKGAVGSELIKALDNANESGIECCDMKDVKKDKNAKKK